MIKFLMILTFSFLFLQSNLFAFVKPIHHHAKSGAHSKKMKVEVLRPDLYEASTNISVNGAYNIASVKRDRLNKSIRILSGDFGVVQERRTRLQHYKEFSLDFLVKNFSLFKVDVSQLKLIEKATYLGEDVQFIQFALLKNNLIIADSSISFRFKGKKLVQIANYSFAEASVGKMQGLSEHELTFKVNKAIPNKSLKTDYEIYRVQQASKNYQLIKVSHYNVVSLDGIELDLQVDVTTGEIFELKESKLYLMVEQL